MIIFFHSNLLPNNFVKFELFGQLSCFEYYEIIASKSHSEKKSFPLFIRIKIFFLGKYRKN